MSTIKEHHEITIKYSRVITHDLKETSKAHLLLQRQFFNDIDKAVQQLITAITSAVKKYHHHHNALKLLNTIQIHCNAYNKWKKNAYDAIEKAMNGIELSQSEPEHMLDDECYYCAVCDRGFDQQMDWKMHRIKHAVYSKKYK